FVRETANAARSNRFFRCADEIVTKAAQSCALAACSVLPRLSGTSAPADERAGREPAAGYRPTEAAANTLLEEDPSRPEAAVRCRRRRRSASARRTGQVP